MGDSSCEWHGHCKDIPVETLAHVYGVVNTLFSAVQLLCYTVLSSALHQILDQQKKVDKNVCDITMKTFEEQDDCEIKASKVAAALLATSCFEVVLSFLALRGAYKANVYFCYMWFIFTSLLVIVVPLLQSIFFIVTTWWNPVSYTIITITGIHSCIKLYGMYIIMNFVRWIRKKENGNSEEVHCVEPLNTKMSTSNSTWTIGQEHNHHIDEDNIVIAA